MKITIYYASIHKERGNTYVIINEFAESAKNAGAEVEVIFLAEKKINNCVACVQCQAKTPGKCALQDDMNELLETFMKSDIVVMATPVYLHNVTAMMKTFIDRMVPLMDPHYVMLDNGYTGHLKIHNKFPKFGVIATGGFPEQKYFEFLSQYFNRLAGEFYSEVIFEIYKGEAVILKMDDSRTLGPILSEYKQNIRKAAIEVVKSMKISKATAQKLDQPFVPKERYIAQANKYWDERTAYYRQSEI